MRLCLRGLLALLLLAPAVEARQAVRKKSVPGASHRTAAARKIGKAGKARRRHVLRQTQPDAERTREIQEALRREGYFKAPASGRWDDATREAMARYQRDQGFTVTGKPEALSLIKLRLGPKYENLSQGPSPPTR